MYIPLNANPYVNDTTDCTIRALSIVLNESWNKIYLDLCAEGYLQKKGLVSNAEVLFGD